MGERGVAGVVVQLAGAKRAVWGFSGPTSTKLMKSIVSR